jgi:glutamate:GABA antiporter
VAAPDVSGEVELTTALALEEKSKLKKSLRRVDMLLFTICAMVGVDTLGQVSSFGAQTFFWIAILSVFFLLPYAFVMSELGSTFAQEGGPYEWMKLAYGRLTASFGAVLYWITNPLWVGGTLCFLASAAFSQYFIHLGGPKIGFLGHTPIFDLLFKVAFIWISIIVAIAALDRGKWIPNFGALCRAFVLLFFSFTVLIYAFKHGINGFGFSDFIPGATSVSGTVIFLGVVPLLLFNYVGFELASAAAEEMVDPQKDVPKSVIRSAIATVILYSLPIFGILVVLPTNKIKGISGFVGAVNAVFGDVYGGAAHMLVKFMVGAFIVSLITSGAVWMIGSDRVLAVASYDGAWAPWFGIFNRKLGTPVRVNTMSGVLSTVFLLFALNLLSGSNASSFQVILALTTSTTLLSYVMIFPTGWLLRLKHGHVHRPYKAPMMALCVTLCTAWMVIGAWVAFVPGTLERALGFSYDYQDVWGVSFARYEAISAGIVVLIAVLTAVGYAMAAPVRAQTASIALDPLANQAATAPASGD